MIVEEHLKERYLRDAVPIRLGNLASSLSRLGFFVQKNNHAGTVARLLEECHSFARWTVSEIDFETQRALSELQGGAHHLGE